MSSALKGDAPKFVSETIFDWFNKCLEGGRFREFDWWTNASSSYYTSLPGVCTMTNLINIIVVPWMTFHLSRKKEERNIGGPWMTRFCNTHWSIMKTDFIKKRQS